VDLVETAHELEVQKHNGRNDSLHLAVRRPAGFRLL